MKLLIFSDVHGNLPAFETMLKDAGKVDGYICLGDVVNYGPWSNECVDLIYSLKNLIYIQGNHERYFIEGKYDGTNPVAVAAFEFCYPLFSRQDKIKNLQKKYLLNDYTFVHTILDSNIYPDSDIKLDNNYVIGHSHHQFKISQPPFTLYNAGSVGQNRKYINIINYLILNTDNMQFDMRSLPYDEQLVIQEMKKRSFPKLCIDYYDNKQRLK